MNESNDDRMARLGMGAIGLVRLGRLARLKWGMYWRLKRLMLWLRARLG